MNEAIARAMIQAHFDEDDWVHGGPDGRAARTDSIRHSSAA